MSLIGYFARRSSWQIPKRYDVAWNVR